MGHWSFWLVTDHWDFQVAQRRQVQDQRAEERRAMYWCMMPAEGAALCRVSGNLMPWMRELHGITGIGMGYKWNIDGIQNDMDIKDMLYSYIYIIIIDKTIPPEKYDNTALILCGKWCHWIHLAPRATWHYGWDNMGYRGIS